MFYTLAAALPVCYPAHAKSCSSGLRTLDGACQHPAHLGHLCQHPAHLGRPGSHSHALMFPHGGYDGLRRALLWLSCPALEEEWHEWMQAVPPTLFNLFNLGCCCCCCFLRQCAGISLLDLWVPKCLSPMNDCQKSVVFGGKMVKIPIPPFWWCHSPGDTICALNWTSVILP